LLPEKVEKVIDSLFARLQVSSTYKRKSEFKTKSIDEGYGFLLGLDLLLQRCELLHLCSGLKLSIIQRKCQNFY
jgi:hypothetical protein